jgi:hypothetical protein
MQAIVDMITTDGAASSDRKRACMRIPQPYFVSEAPKGVLTKMDTHDLLQLIQPRHGRKPLGFQAPESMPSRSRGARVQSSMGGRREARQRQGGRCWGAHEGTQTHKNSSRRLESPAPSLIQKDEASPAPSLIQLDDAKYKPLSVSHTSPSAQQVGRAWEGVLALLEHRRTEKMAGVTRKKESPLTREEDAFLANLFLRV